MGETATLLALLQRHYIKPGQDLPGGVFLPEVGINGTWGSGSRCDAIYVGFTSTSGRLLVGHELKISRADWLNELNKSGKADDWADQCHEWNVVAPNPAIIHDGELPAGWGLMIPGRSKTRMQIHTKAWRKPFGHQPSWDAVRSVIARHDTLRAQAISAARAKARDDANAEVNERVQRLVELELAKRPDAADLERKLKLIEETLGCPIDFSDRDYPLHGHIDLESLGQLGALARAHGSVSRVARNLATGWGNPVTQTRRALDQLDVALGELTRLAVSAAEPAAADPCPDDWDTDDD